MILWYLKLLPSLSISEELLRGSIGMYTVYPDTAWKIRLIIYYSVVVGIKESFFSSTWLVFLQLLVSPFMGTGTEISLVHCDNGWEWSHTSHSLTRSHIFWLWALGQTRSTEAGSCFICEQTCRKNSSQCTSGKKSFSLCWRKFSCLYILTETINTFPWADIAVLSLKLEDMWHEALCFLLFASGFSWQRSSQGSRTPSGCVYQWELHLERQH